MIRNGHIESASAIVDRIASEPIKNHLLRMGIIKCKKALAHEMESFLEVKKDLFVEYGEDDGMGNFQVLPDSEKFAEFAEAYQMVLNGETTYIGPVLPPLILDMIELSADEVELLISVGLIEDGDESKTPDTGESAG